jgi:hypothetical protein
MWNTGIVNKSVFDPLLAGFADSNSKMREETLKCLVHVVGKHIYINIDR